MFFSRAILHHRQVRYLGAFYLHSLTRLFATSLFQIFTSIYLYQSLQHFGLTDRQSLGLTTFFFSFTFLMQALSTPLALWLMSKKGLRLLLIWGNILLVGFSLVFFLGKFDPIFFIIAAILGGLQMGIYWNAYHIFFAKLSDDSKQGEEVALSVTVSAAASIAAPSFGGLIINYAGFGATFLVMALIILLANLPLKYLPKTKDTIEIDINKLLRFLSPKRELKSWLGITGAGIIDTVYSSFWPLFVFPILTNYIGIGFMGSLSALVFTLVTVVLGYIIDRFGAKKILKIFSPFDSIIWALKGFVVTPAQVFIIAITDAITLSGQMISIDSLIYERARREDIVSLIIQRELGLSLSKFIFLFFIAILFWMGMPFIGLFIIAAVMALLTQFYPNTKISRN